MAIRVASTPVSWGILEFDGMEPTFSSTRVLDEIAGCGYTGIELGPYGFLPTDPALLRAELEERNLRLLSAFVPVRLLDPDARHEATAEALEVGRLLSALDARYVVLADQNGVVPDLIRRAGRRRGAILSGSEWDVVAASVTMIATRLRDETGLSTVFHHHCAGYVETPEETRELLARTDPGLVGLCLDTGHWHYAGGDAVACVREFGPRVRYLHLKDCHPVVARECREQERDYFEAVRAGVFCPLGEGGVDFPGVISVIEQHGYDEWAVVEQDVLSDDPEAPRRSAAASRSYLRSIGV